MKGWKEKGRDGKSNEGSERGTMGENKEGCGD